MAKTGKANLFSETETNGKNKQYARLQMAVVACGAVDVICTSGPTYDAGQQEWYDNDERWGVDV